MVGDQQDLIMFEKVAQCGDLIDLYDIIKAREEDVFGAHIKTYIKLQIKDFKDKEGAKDKIQSNSLLLYISMAFGGLNAIGIFLVSMMWCRQKRSQ